MQLADLARALCLEISTGDPDLKLVWRAIVLLLRYADWAQTPQGWIALARCWPEFDSAVEWLYDVVPFVVLREMQHLEMDGRRYVGSVSEIPLETTYGRAVKKDLELMFSGPVALTDSQLEGWLLFQADGFSFEAWKQIWLRTHPRAYKGILTRLRKKYQLPGAAVPLAVA